MSKITFVSSVAWVCGALFGYCVARHICEKGFEEERERLERIVRTLRKTEKDTVKDEADDDAVEKKDYDKIVKDAYSTMVGKMYSTPHIPTNPNEEMKNSIDISSLKRCAEKTKEEVFTPVDSEIEIISEEEFFNPSVDHEVVELGYWALDKVLADERDEIVDNEEAMVGSDWVEHFGEAPDDTDVVYVRNHRLKTDFEILRKEMSFAEVVLGIVGEE